MNIKTSERITQIETYVRLNPFCSLDSIFTQGKIPKSKATRELVNHMVAQNTIQISKTSTGKNRYYIESKQFEIIIKWRTLDFELNKLNIETMKLGKKHRILQKICKQFLHLLDSRLKILKFEAKYAEELDLKIEQIPYKDRDHALFVAYGPYVNPRYAISIIVEHGGSGSKAAAPMAKELFKLIIDRDGLREKQSNFEEIDI